MQRIACITVCMLALVVSSVSLAQDRLEPLEIGEAVEVFFLNEWRPGKVLATDRQQNARVEFEFANARKVDEFLRAAIRRPYEKGAIIATRTYADATGNFKIIAAAVAITNDQIRLRKRDGSEIDVPLAKLSDSDQRYLKTLIKQGLQVSQTLPGPKLPGMRTWALRDGRSVEGIFVSFDQGKVLIKLADGSLSELSVTQLGASDVSFAMEQEAAAQRSRVDAELRGGNPTMSGDSGLPSVDFGNLAGGDGMPSNVGAAGSAGKPAVELRSQMLAEDQWGFEPDAVQRQKLLPAIEAKLTISEAAKVVNRDGTKALIISQTGGSYLVDLVSGRVSDVGDVAEAIDARGILGIKSISPDARLIAYQPRREEEVVHVHDLESGKDIVAGWAPYGIGRDIHYIQFLDEKHLLTVSQRGDLGVWELATKKLVWWTVTRPVCVPAISSGGKYIIWHTNEHLVVGDALTGKVVSQVRSNPAGVRVLAVDDTCQRLVGLGNGNARFWNLKTGNTVLEFGIPTAVFEPSFAFWTSSTQVLVNGLRTESALFDVIDLSIQGSAYCVNMNGVLLSAPNQGNIHGAVMPGRFLVMHPEIPSEAMLEGTSRTFNDLFVDIQKGSKVQIDLAVPASMDRATELQRVSSLFTQAGYEVVESGGDVTFVASVKESQDYTGVDLDDLPNEAFQPKQNLMLVKDGVVVWRATKDIFGVDKENRWSGFVIPSKLRIPQERDICFVLRKPGQWVNCEMERRYDSGIQQSYRFSNTYQANE